MNISLTIQPVETVDLQIERHLRTQIQKGELESGARLPPTGELSRQWHVGRTTISKAMARLTAEGLIERKPKHGTFVTSRTDKAVIGVLMGTSLGDETAHFFRAVVKAIHRQMNERTWTCRVYDGFTPIEDIEQTVAHLRQRLASDLRNYAFKGILDLGSQARRLKELRIDTKLPMASLYAEGSHSDLVFDMYRFGQESVNFLAEAGRKRMVYLRGDISKEGKDLEGVRDAVRQRNLPTPRIEPLYGVGGYALEKEAFQKISHLFQEWDAQQNRHNAPDALMVSDDIAMRGVALALARHGVVVPEKLLVLTLANEGVDLHYGIPVVRYEYSPAEIARELVALLLKRVLKQPVPPLPIAIRGRIRVEDEETIATPP
ncbi:MAG: GntR family transcriptional regulator [Verrucomicrobia bacterium]|nr:GntR family transcriptional regulator [Verrucomicrobiota bacterium]